MDTSSKPVTATSSGTFSPRRCELVHDAERGLVVGTGIARGSAPPAAQHPAHHARAARRGVYLPFHSRSSATGVAVLLGHLAQHRGGG